MPAAMLMDYADYVQQGHLQLCKLVPIKAGLFRADRDGSWAGDW
jgi:hypothetical protein